MAGVTPDQMTARLPKGIVVDAVGSFVMAFILVHAVHYAGAQGVGQGAAVGFFNWLGFIAVTGFSATIYEGQPMRLFAINTGFLLIALMIMGAILAVWV